MSARRRTGTGWLAVPLAAFAFGPLAAQGAQAGDEGAHAGSMGDEPGASAEAPALPAESPLAEVRVDEDERTIELVIGPVELPAGGPHLRPPVQLVDVPVTGWLHGFSWEMRDASGGVLPDRLLHHVNVIDPDRRELFSTVARRVMAAGRETAGESMPGILGVPLEKDTRYLVSAMFASRPDESFDEAYLHIELRYTPSDDPGLIAPRTVYPFYVDVMGPVGEKEFPLPPGTHGMSWEGSPAIDGRILALGGHLHDYGDWIRLEDLTTGDVVWETAPERRPDGTVVGVPTGKLWWRGGVPVYADHRYRLSVQYTNPLDRPAPDMAMGALGGVLLAGEGDWPPFDRSDADYVADLRNTLEKPNEAHHGHGDMAGMDGGEAGDAADHEHSADGGHGAGAGNEGATPSSEDPEGEGESGA